MFGLPEESTGKVGPADSAALVDLAAAQRAGLRMGTSSWSFPGWEGLVYDRRTSEQVLARHGLRAYARHPLFRTVGVDRTYYAPVSAEAFADYAAVVPEDFRFLVKAHQDLTMPWVPGHPRFGERRGTQNDRFLDAAYASDAVVGPFAEGLGQVAGPLLFQFPPLNVAAIGGPRGFALRLSRFLGALPRGCLYAVELRNVELLTPAYGDALAEHGAVHCLNAHPRMPSLLRQADLVGPAFLSAPAVVVRWMLSRSLDYEGARERYRPFDRLVDADPDTRESVATLVLAESRPTWVVVNNKAEGSSPLSVRALAERLARRLGKP